MNKKQQEKLDRLKKAAADADINLAEAKNALDAVVADDQSTEEAKGNAQKVFEDATAARDKANTEAAEYEASVTETKPAKAKNAANEDASASVADARTKLYGPAVVVVAVQDRRRIGKSFPKGEKVSIPLDDLSKAQLQALKDDPFLAVNDG